MPFRQLPIQEALHLRVTTIPRDLEASVIDGEPCWVRVALDQEVNNLESILPHGKVERLAVMVMGANQRWVFRDQSSYRCDVPLNASAKKAPYVDALAGRPDQRFVFRQWF